MHSHLTSWRTRITAGASAAVLSAFALTASVQAADPNTPVDAIRTATPIKHVIIIVGENRSFDHLFATYVPRHAEEGIRNLLSEGIVNADGTPGHHFARAHQYQISSAPNGGKFFSSAGLANKTLYGTLPPPDLNGVGAVSPYVGIVSLPGGDPGLPPEDQSLFGTGGTGLSSTLGPDMRITNVNALPPGPFQLTGPDMPFDAFTGDTIHQYFQMVQQMDCAMGAEHVSRSNPTGCLHDLQSDCDHDLQYPAGRHPARHRADHGLLQHAERGCAALKVPRRSVHDERQLSPAGDGRHGAGQPAARLRRPGVLQPTAPAAPSTAATATSATRLSISRTTPPGWPITCGT